VAAAERAGGPAGAQKTEAMAGQGGKSDPLSADLVALRSIKCCPKAYAVMMEAPAVAVDTREIRAMGQMSDWPPVEGV
jgi:hypothetical protein